MFIEFCVMDILNCLFLMFINLVCCHYDIDLNEYELNLSDSYIYIGSLLYIHRFIVFSFLFYLSYTHQEY